jgi:GNAT superfamily N-acetyltransferase
MPELVTYSGDIGLVGRSLALAYEVNPLVRWMFADDLSPARLESLFTSLVEFGVRHGLVYRSRKGDGAAIWFPPLGEDRSGPGDEAADVAADTAEWSSNRRGAALDALASERPTVAHFYLDAVGVLPLGRRQGTASDLLAPVLAECDAKGIGAYLENSDSANARFYGHLGFREVAPIRMPEGAPSIVSMWRSPRPTGDLPSNEAGLTATLGSGLIREVLLT